MKTLFSIGLLFMALGLIAQDDMPEIWDTKIDHQITYAGLSDRGDYVYGADEKNITVLNHGDGSVKWTARFKDMAPRLRKIDELIPLWEANVIFIFERKGLSKDVMACVDVHNGEVLWTSEEYSNVSEENVIFIPEMEAFALSLKEGLVMIKARTGEELWNTALFKGTIGQYDYTSDGQLVMINFKPSALGALFAGFKNQLVKINPKNGDIVWESNYIGLVRKKAISREPLVNLSVENDKVFLMLNGLQVYDYNTGAKLWDATFEELPEVKKVKKPKGALRFGVYETVANPVVVGNDVYVLDMKSKSKQFVRKYDLNSGKLLWTSPEIKGGARIIPNMYVTGDRVILQIGGKVEAQALIRRERNVGKLVIVYNDPVIWYPNIKPNGLKAIDANTGQMVWDSERFKKGITNVLVADGVLYVCSGKELYAMDPVNGDETYTVALGGAGVGLATAIFDEPGKIMVIAEKGLACYNMEDGSLINAGKFKKTIFGGISGNAYKLDNPKGGFAVYNSDNCSYRVHKPKKDAQSMLTLDGKHVFVYVKKNITKLAAQ